MERYKINKTVERTMTFDLSGLSHQEKVIVVSEILKDHQEVNAGRRGVHVLVTDHMPMREQVTIEVVKYKEEAAGLTEKELHDAVFGRDTYE